MDTEDRLTALEARLEKLSPAVRSNTSRIRSLRACGALLIFLGVVGFVQIEKIEWSTDRQHIVFRDPTWQTLGFGFVAVGFIMDSDGKMSKRLMSAVIDKWTRS